MSNRQDRRASAKLVKQAAKRGRTQAERSILAAASGFVRDDAAEADLSLPDIDVAWERLFADLEEMLGADFLDFRAELYDDASRLFIGGRRPDGSSVDLVAKLFLCPVSGEERSLDHFAHDAASLTSLAASFREHGVFPEASSTVVLPAVLAPQALALSATGPGGVHALTRHLAAFLIAPQVGQDGSADAGTAEEGVLPVQFRPRPTKPSGAATVVSGALVGINLAPHDPEEGSRMTDEALDAEDMALAASLDSWLDNYALDLEDVVLGEPTNWSGCAGAVAWQRVQVALELELATLSPEDRAVSAIHYAVDRAGDDVVLVAEVDGRFLGPFRTPTELAFCDFDAFVAGIEATGGEMREHRDERSVVALVQTMPQRTCARH